MKTTVKERLLGAAVAGVAIVVGCVPMLAESGMLGSNATSISISSSVSDMKTEAPELTEKPVTTETTMPTATESAKPVETDNPTTTEPVTTETTKPTATESAKPAETDNPTTTEPVTTETTKPTATEPAETGNPTTTEPVTMETDKPATTEPAITETDKPVTTEPATTETDKPITTEPAITETDKPITTEPATTETDKPVTTQAPAIIEDEDIVPSDQLVSKVIETMKEIAENVVEITTDAAPLLDKTVFEAMLKNGKDVLVAVVNEKNEKIYSWNFSKQSLENTNADVDLTVIISDDAQVIPAVSEIEEAIKIENVLAVSCSYKGKLPGTAILQTYVGNKYQDGEKLYLYKYASAVNASSDATVVKAVDEKSITIVDKEGIIVKDGYVDFKIAEGADYFLSPTLTEDIEEDPVQEVLWAYADVNKDGKIDLEDAQLALCAALGIGDFTSVQIASIDIDGNNEADLEDAQNILEIALGIIKLEDVLPQ